MKKLYSTIALAAAVAISASAASFKAAPAAEKFFNIETTPVAEISANIAATKAAKHRTPAKRQAINSAADVTGVWFLEYMDVFEGEYAYRELAVTNSKFRPTTLTISGFYPNAKVTGTLDLAAGSITIKSGQTLGSSSAYGAITLDIRKAVEGATYISEWEELTEVVGTYYDGLFILPENTFIGAKVNTTDGVQYMIILAAFDPIMGPADPTDWVELGVGTYCDGIILSCFDIDGLECPYEVNIYEDADVPGRYKVADPYTSKSLAEATEWEEINEYLTFYEGGAVVIDASDPEFVVVDPRFSTGCDISAGETGILYASNYPGYYMISVGYPRSVASTIFDDEEDPTYFKGFVEDGVITVPLTTFANAGDPLSSYYGWVYYEDDDEAHENPISVPMVTKLTLPGAGVEGVTIDNSNAPVEYFNLQGVRVANPESGLYIRRQGNKATKVIK